MALCMGSLAIYLGSPTSVVSAAGAAFSQQSATGGRGRRGATGSGGESAARGTTLGLACNKDAPRDSTRAMKDTMVATIAQAKPPPSGLLGSMAFMASTYVFPSYLLPPATTVPTKMAIKERNTRKKRACLRGGAFELFLCVGSEHGEDARAAATLRCACGAGGVQPPPP